MTENLDKFYTNPDIVEMCLGYLQDTIPMNTFDFVLEPSAGNGSFFHKIDHPNKLGIDISPESDSIFEQDFLEFTQEVKYENILVVGNPPFGRVSSLAIKFFNHAATFANVIAFIVPRTFRRTSVMNRLNFNFDLILDIEIPTEPCSFTPKMLSKCCFQIWQRSEIVRSKINLPTVHHDFQFVKHGPVDELGQPTPPIEPVDFVIRAYGHKCGEILTEGFEVLRPKSWHWIKCTEGLPVDIILERFKSLDYTLSLDTARQNSIGKADLVQLYHNNFY